jgi:hypothetical protein
MNDEPLDGGPDDDFLDRLREIAAEVESART